MDILFAELEAHWGLILIIAFLLGMGTPYPGKLKNLDQILPLLEGITNLLETLKTDRDATPEKKDSGEDGSP
jgi:hypothetical protein